MTSVVDASVLVAALVDQGGHGLWAEAAIGAGELIAPELLPAETSNILRRLERAKVISPMEANAAHGDLRRLEVQLFPYAPFAGRIWELHSNLTTYDAWYVAVAEAFECPLLTLDRKLCIAPGPACEFAVPQ